MITLNGNHGEGGGSLLRTALALSTLTNKPFKINNIRANRPKPGLKQQHLEAIKALKQICPGAKSSELTLGQTSIWFYPSKVKSGSYEFDIKTAGSITLFLQAIILPSMFTNSKITIKIKGGTCGKWQASVDFLQRVLLPLIERFTKSINLSIIKRGYYPKGQGEVILEISPLLKQKDFRSHEELIKHLNTITKPYNLTEQGNVEQIKGFINLSQDLQDKQIGERIVKATTNKLRSLEVPINIDLGYFQAKSTGGEILLWTINSINKVVDPNNSPRLSTDKLLEKTQTSEQLGEEVAKELIETINSKAAIDTHLTDQLIIYAALLNNSKLLPQEISGHTKTNIYITKQFLDITETTENNTITLSNKQST